MTPDAKVKTALKDRKTVHRLAQFHQAGELFSVHIPTAADEAIRDLARTRAGLVIDRIRSGFPTRQVLVARPSDLSRTSGVNRRRSAGLPRCTSMTEHSPRPTRAIGPLSPDSMLILVLWSKPSTSISIKVSSPRQSSDSAPTGGSPNSTTAGPARTERHAVLRTSAKKAAAPAAAGEWGSDSSASTVDQQPAPRRDDDYGLTSSSELRSVTTDE